EPAFDVAARLGSASLSGDTYSTIGKISGAPRTQAEFDGTAHFIERAAKAAMAHGLKLGIEPCNRYETHIMNTGADGRAYCEAVGMDNVFIHMDTYHMNIEERSMETGFRDCGPFLGYVHLSESNRAAPGSGCVDWMAAFSALAAIGFEGTLTLESMNHVHPAIASALAIWKPVETQPADVINKGLPFLHATAAANNVHFA
ncbi:MAG: sugar phosphate isomerase/epimerase family protein, partial [Pseudomonadota bacterium]